ncbi:rho guanine nucleotide exchange factor 28 isoform X3 [Phycodurus eques]|uniref:rho guanine nucleotide exchange factor 28 isoform X3 n=1 Tax=Phycodurus eques TaxID=693459 RepID=UPI002ACE758C|nr:rho guanine nucleotide exchange factor 28 isoform X3 [Phycodurus eques]XP_061554995.1 rho guanine nucleotide exchange factor 28 isoform X3 [Phycodurus eques]XP_061554996.1 rho guanine nucleotide exchange factor 28 isoform X3 [Phycodurus eques]XP_061554997.1 rho guanine nucleotide exchange factor 28 isoform X3 [Phycodurus eques]
MEATRNKVPLHGPLRDTLGDRDVLNMVKRIQLLRAEGVNAEHVPPEKVHMQSRGEHFTQHTAVRIGRVISGVTSVSTDTDGTFSDHLLAATDAPPPPSEGPPAAMLAPDAHATDPPLYSCSLSPSHVSLEVDSEDDDAETRTLSSPPSSTVDRNSGTGPPCARSLSTSSACEPVPNKLSESAMRLRSYSYSSAKIPSRPPRFGRNASSPDDPPHGGSHSRSLLQALSLSISLSLLHPAKQRASESQSHEKREFRSPRDDNEGGAAPLESLRHLTLSEFLKEIDEEQDRNVSDIPTKADSDKYKVIRTFSFLKSKMSNTRNKTKTKGKDQESKDRRTTAQHFFANTCVSPTTCVVCDKPVFGKDLLHCAACTATVHKACKESIPPCFKKLQEKNALITVKSRTASLPQNFTIRESPPQCAMPPMDSKDPAPSGSLAGNDGGLTESSESEMDTGKPSCRSEELQTTSCNHWSPGEDYSDLAADAADYEAESWSLTVELNFCKKQDRRAVKRQDVIYELMQTELHHLQTLHIMAAVFRRGLREEVQLDSEALERLFPCLDQLLTLHRAFFAALKDRRHNSAQPREHKNYLMQRVGDVLLHQFSDESGEKMRRVYGEFCSRHSEAVGLFKALLQNNKRFHNFVKQQGGNSLVRRREIPECILLVTQRITKYPVLLERILQYTQEGTAEHGDLSATLARMRQLIAAVELRVSEYERRRQLRDVWSRTESRSTAKLKNGRTLRKQDMMGQTLKHQGALLWKTATGRLKDVLALLLTDSLVFLQEKDQKYTFAAVDHKPPVIALQKLIVREVANEERGMFLISASASGPEMYEVRAASKEERDAWMRIVHQAVESCPKEEEEYSSESEEEKRVAEARFQKVQKLQESLTSRDQQICSSLEDKLRTYAALSAGAAPVEPRLLVRPRADELPRASVLLGAALREAENLKHTLESRSGRSPDSGGDSALAGSPVTPPEQLPDREAASPADREIVQFPSPTHLQSDDFNIARSVQSLTQLLYSLQAAVTIQDSCYELQRFLLREAGLPPQRPPSARGAGDRRVARHHLEKCKDDPARNRECWERERQAREIRLGEKESGVDERERRCLLLAEELRREREELERQQEEYRTNLERLRQGQRSMERKREHLEKHRKVLHTWRHGRQRSLPDAIIPLDGQQLLSFDLSSIPSQNSSVGNGDVFATGSSSPGGGLVTIGNNNKRKGSDGSAHSCLDTLLAMSNSRTSVAPDTSTISPEAYGRRWTTAGALFDQRHTGEAWPSSASDGGKSYPPPLVTPDLGWPVSMETGDNEEVREETVVYL